jgi:8-oxo-dGTP pyrophosphatase MutT (NUDIX family)
MNQDLLQRLRRELENPQQRSTTGEIYAAELSYGRYRGPAPETAVRAAVMILLYPDAPQGAPAGPDDGAAVSDWGFPLTLRPLHLQKHGGQISLPGGAAERGETSLETAQRELAEELGVPVHEVEQLGQLSEIYVFASNYLVTPHVGFVTKRPRWQPQQAEVAEVIEMSLAHLIDPKNIQFPLKKKQGIFFQAPCIVQGNRQIWGATCLILGELIAAVRRAAGFEEAIPRRPRIQIPQR